MTGRVFTDPRTKFFEDFEEGDLVITRGRTVSANDFMMFAGMTGDFYPLHIDEEFAKKTRFGTRISHGPLTFTIAVGLVGLTDYLGDAVVALQGIDEMRATAPVKPGDTLKVHALLQTKDGSQNEKYGSISMLYTVKNQHEETVMTYIQTMLTKKRSKGE